MTDGELDARLAELEGIVYLTTSDFRPTISGIRKALTGISSITRLSLELTHEIIRRVRNLEKRHDH